MTGHSGRAPYNVTCLDFGGAANNYPLKGGKASLWEGGIRVANFVSGGYLPLSARGTHVVGDAMMHTADWMATLAHLARVNFSDPGAVTRGLPDVDSLNCWPLLIGANSTSPRTEFVLGGVPGPRGLMQGRFKLLLGHGNGLGMSTHTGPHFPNASSAAFDYGGAFTNCSTGCLFDVVDDPTERVNLASQMPDLVNSMTRRLEALEATAWTPERGQPQSIACHTASVKYGGFYGPFAPVPP